MASLLSSASVQQIATLLDLYPVEMLRENWQDIPGIKYDMCLEIAGKRDISEISTFIHDHFGICKQNVYVFRNDSGLEKALSLEIPGFELSYDTVTEFGVSKTYMVRYEVDLILRAPLDEIKIDFILPVRIDFSENYLIVRFVKFERDFNHLFKGRNPLQPRQVEKERAYLSTINRTAQQIGLILTNADLHQGVKALWGGGFMDAPKVKYKTEDSTDSKNMDGNKGVRGHNPAAYDIIKDKPLHSTLFIVEGTEKRPEIVITIDPSKGFLSFGRYTTKNGDSNYVVHEILRHNE